MTERIYKVTWRCNHCSLINKGEGALTFIMNAVARGLNEGEIKEVHIIDRVEATMQGLDAADNPISYIFNDFNGRGVA